MALRDPAQRLRRARVLLHARLGDEAHALGPVRAVQDRALVPDEQRAARGQRAARLQLLAERAAAGARRTR